MPKKIKTLLIVFMLSVLPVSINSWARHGNSGIPVVINEFAASNNSSVTDPQGQFEDWIELYNYDNEDIDISGMYLTDDLNEPRKWQFPDETIIPAEDFLLVWADNDTTDSGLHSNFELNAEGEEIGFFDSDGLELIDSITYSEQSTDISFGRFPDAEQNWLFLATPTPGSPNQDAYSGVVADTKFSHNRDFYESPFEVTITTETPDAVIHYTLDGSEPTESRGARYENPISINTTTILKAMAFKPDFKSTNIDAQTYIFLDDVIQQPDRPSGFPASWSGYAADYEMDPDIINERTYRSMIKDALLSLPAMSITMNTDDMFGNESGIYSNPLEAGVDWERPGSVELFYPDGTEGFQVNCGIRIQGGYFRRNDMSRKHSFRLLFKGIYGPTKLNFPLFGKDAADSFDTIVLRAGANDGYAWNAAKYTEQYTRDEFARRLQLATGNASAHGIFVHLYINGLYWGLYNPCERPDNAFSATYFGGEKENWDALHEGGYGDNAGAEATNGDFEAWNLMLEKCRQAASSNTAYLELQGKNPDGTDNPAHPNLLDVQNYIDYLIVNIWAGNWDWPWKNYWIGRDRSGNSTGFKFYNWDCENTIGNNLDRSPLNKNTLNNDFSDAGRPHQSLRNNPEYRLLFADRIHKFFFNGGILTSASLYGSYLNIASEIELAMVAESARWGDMHYRPPLTLEDWYDRDSNYNDGRAGLGWILDYYIPQRSDIVMNQFRNAGLYPNVDAPVFFINGYHQHGGQINPNSSLTMMNSGQDIWYTTDGSDPRLPEYSNQQDTDTFPILFTENAAKRVLVPRGPVDNTWRGGGDFDDSNWISDTGGVGYDRSSGYEQYINIDVEDLMYGGNTSCLIRIPFELSTDNLSQITSLILKLRYEDGFVAWLNGIEVARGNIDGEPLWNSASDYQRNDNDAVYLEPFDISEYIDLLDTGQNILAIHGLNLSTGSSDFLISAMLTADDNAAGNPGTVSASAVRYTGPIPLQISTHIKARILDGDTWSALNETVYSVGPVADNLRITEIMYHPAYTGNPDDPNTEYIELTNIGVETINLNLAKFTNGIDFIFPDMELSPGGYVLAVKDIDAFEAKYGQNLSIAGQYEGRLNNAGERIKLEDAAGQVILDFTFKDGWYGSTDGGGFSLTVIDPAINEPTGWSDKANYRPSVETGGSPGFDDTEDIPRLGEIVINEILAHSHDTAPDWIELYNASETSVNIGGWFLSDNESYISKYVIAEPTIVPPGGYIVFYEDLYFGNPDNPGTNEPFRLSENGENLYLNSARNGILTGYSEQEQFDASETGISFGRFLTSDNAYIFVLMSSITPGTANAYPKVGPVIINEIMYNPASDDQDEEYIELLNISDSQVALYYYDEEQFVNISWRLNDTNGISYDFPIGTRLMPGEFLLLVKDRNTFLSRYPAAGNNAQLLEWGPGRLDNAGEQIQLLKPGDEFEGTRYYILIDKVKYSDGSHPDGRPDLWPPQADGDGFSLSRINPDGYGNDVINWQAAPPSPGQ